MQDHKTVDHSDKGKRKLVEEVRTLRSRLSKLEQGNIIGTQGVGRDITDRKKAVDMLRESEQRYRAIFEQAADSIVLINAETGELVEFNDKAHEILGYSREEFQKLRIPDFEIIESDDEVAKHIEKIVRKGADTFETKHRTKDGQIRDIMVSSRAISIGGKNFCQGIWRDITERKEAEEAILSERNKLISVFEAMEDGAYIVNQQHDIQYVNPVLEKSFGPSQGRKCYQYFHDRKEVCPWCKNDDVFAGKTVRWEWYSSKNQKTYDLIDTPLENPDGSISKLEIFRDITERKKAEQELRASEERYRNIFNSVCEAVFIIDFDGRIIDANPKASYIYGYSPEEFTNLPAKKLIHPEDHHIFDEHIEILAKTGEFHSEHRNVRKDGTIIDVEVSATTIECEGKKFLVSIINDITERKDAEQKIIRAKEEWERTFMAVPDLIAIIDKQHRIVRVNKAMAERMGVAPDEAAGMICYECIHGTKEPPKFCPHTKLLADGREHTEEIYEEHLGGHFVVSVSPLCDNDGSLIGCVHVARDITEHRQTESERECMIRLLHLINANNNMHKLMETVTTFLRDWSGCEAVGIRLQEGEDFPYFETRGFDEEFILAENNLCSVDEIGQLVRDSEGKAYLECMCGNIIRGRFDPSKPFFTEHGSFWTNSTTELLAGTSETDRLARTRNRCNTAGYESVALVPLQAWAETFGLLQFNDKRKGRFTPEIISLLERLADNLAIGLAQRRAEDALRISETRYKSLFDHMSSGVAVYEALEDGSDFIFKDLNQAGERINNVKRDDVLGRKVTEIFPAVKDFGLLEVFQRVWRTGKPQQHPVSLYADGRLARWFENYVYKLPSGEIVAVHDDVTEGKEAEKTLITYQNDLRSLASKLTSTEEFQRRQIAADLHDNVSQALALSINQLRRLCKSAASGDAKTLDEVCQMIEKSMQNIHDLTFDLASPTLYKIGLEAAVSELLDEQLRDRHGIICEFSDDKKAKPLDEDVRVLVFKAVRELLVNVIKHSEAHKVAVAIKRKKDNIQICVNDDGVGFDTEKAKASIQRGGGFGLFNVRERLDYIGGTFEMHSQPGSGSRFILTAPIKA